MGVTIAVIISPNGAWIVIAERYPQPGARSSRLTALRTRNPATPAGAAGAAGGAAAAGEAERPGRQAADVSSGVPTSAAFISFIAANRRSVTVMFTGAQIRRRGR